MVSSSACTTLQPSHALAPSPSYSSSAYQCAHITHTSRTHHASLAVRVNASGRGGPAGDAVVVEQLLALGHRARGEHDDRAHAGVRKPGLAVATGDREVGVGAADLLDRVAVVDDVLSPSALQEVQRHAAEAIIWHDPRESYVGAYGNSGLLTSTTVRIAAELGKLLPRVICGRRLRQLWAYKFSKDNQARPLADSGINVHADDALVSVNIWVQGGDEDSEGESLTSGGGGGLLVYPGYRSGIGESFQQYNRQPGRIRRLLSAAGAKFDRIEHKVNRAVIFDSSIFHESDAGTARTYGSELKTRRINLTFLFGRRGEGCHEEKSKRVDDAS